MPFQKGETLMVINQDEDDWWTAENRMGQRGSIPVPYVQIVSYTSGNVTLKTSGEFEISKRYYGFEISKAH